MILLIVTTCLAVSFSGTTGYNFNLMDTSAYSVFAPTFGYHLLLVDGGTLYYNSMSTETMTWLCRMLGYQSYGGYTQYSSYSWMQSHPVRYTNLDCSGTVVPQCRYQKYRAYYSNALWLSCNARTQYGDSSSFYLVGKDKQHTQKEHGLLMYNRGTVSGDKFDDSTAELICQIMGFTGAMGWNVGRKYVEDQEDMRIRLNNLNCLTKDRPFPLCTFGTDVMNVTHEEDVWLWCDMPNTNKIVCPPGQRKYSSNKCLECSRNTYSSEPSESSSCTSCPSGSTSLPGSTLCSCNEGTYMSFGGQCLDCPGNSTSHKGSTFCTCVSGTYLYTDGSCVACPSGTISREGATTPSDCVRCPAGSLPINKGQVCSCERGFGWVWSTNMGELGYCRACPANFYKDKELGTCVRCPHEATSLPLSEDCRCPIGLSWDGQSCVDCITETNRSGVCTCLAGTFWSEPSSRCKDCPENHFSGNFFSICSKCPINTVSAAQSAECTSCSKGFFWHEYRCTKCPENHIGNGATCSVCPDGTSPSKDKSICQKSADDVLSVVSLTLCILLLVIVMGNIFITWKEKRERAMTEDLQLAYQAEPSTAQVKVHGLKCMCPSCPCSLPSKPALPSKEVVEQDDVYADYS